MHASEIKVTLPVMRESFLRVVEPCQYRVTQNSKTVFWKCVHSEMLSIEGTRTEVQQFEGGFHQGTGYGIQLHSCEEKFEATFVKTKQYVYC